MIVDVCESHLHLAMTHSKCYQGTTMQTAKCSIKWKVSASSLFVWLPVRGIRDQMTRHTEFTIFSSA